ncbi:ATP-binding protein [Achromobacter xylosoxidans]|uniref:ATP-binding protein n=1 Tax=Alcaligenes xylosoxydans xylosoxydans TaxID=85698 RepID=UPI001F144763|nr:ATP-binding protein [Achromobacter xylosoxidans]
MKLIDLKEIATRESERVEWKENVADVPDLVRTAVAFANDYSNLGGGYIVCGAIEKKDEHGFQAVELVGLTSARFREVEGQLMAHCRDKVDPPVTPIVYEERIDGADDRRVLIFVIPSTGYAHCYRSDGADSSRYWVRIGRDTREARDGLLRELLVRKGQLPPWDRRAAVGSDVAEIDLVFLRDAFQRLGIWNPHRAIEDYLSSNESISPFVPPLLVNGGDGRPSPRNFAMLLFGRDSLKYIPGAYIVFSIYRGKDRSEPTAERRELVGSILDQTRKVIEQLNAEAYVVYDKESATPNQNKYPIRALQEAVVNAIVHRDYEVGEPVRVTVFSDRIEIVSPGSLPRVIDEERFRSGKAAPFWQNQALAYFFSKLQFAQAEGQGIPTIIRSMHEIGCPPPSFVIEPGRVTCILPAHPRHAILRELQAIENKIIIGRNDEAIDQLEELLNKDPSNFRALELLCQVSISTGDAQILLGLVMTHLEVIKNTINASTLLTISEALLTTEENPEARQVAATLNETASSRHLEATELRRAAINLRKLKEDDKALELIEDMFRKDPAFKRNASLLQLAGKAQIDLAKKCIDKARDRGTSRDMKSRAWELCRTYLSDAERNLRSAREFATDFEREYVERDLEFLAHMQQISVKPSPPTGNRFSGAAAKEKAPRSFKRRDPKR